MAMKSVIPNGHQQAGATVIAFPPPKDLHFDELREEHPKWPREKVGRVAMLCGMIEERLDAGLFDTTFGPENDHGE